MAEDVEQALAEAAAEYGLQAHYIPCVRPLLEMPEQQWPTCCGGGCEPCSTILCGVAARTKDLLKAKAPLRNP